MLRMKHEIVFSRIDRLGLQLHDGFFAGNPALDRMKGGEVARSVIVFDT